MDTSFELEGGRVKTNQSNETTLKVISIKIMSRTDTKNKNLGWSKINYFKLACAFHQLQNRNGTFLHKLKVYKTIKSCTNGGSNLQVAGRRSRVAACSLRVATCRLQGAG